MIDRWRVRRGHSKHTLRITIGEAFREFGTADARAIADRIHDVCDVIEQETRYHRDKNPHPVIHDGPCPPTP